MLVELFKGVEDVFELLKLTDLCQLNILAFVGELEVHGLVKSILFM